MNIVEFTERITLRRGRVAYVRLQYFLLFVAGLSRCQGMVPVADGKGKAVRAVFSCGSIGTSRTPASVFVVERTAALPSKWIALVT